MKHEEWIDTVLKIRKKLSNLPAGKKGKVFSSLPENVKKKALTSPYINGRKKQVEALRSDANTILILCGRGWGKNWIGSQWVLDKVERGHEEGVIVAESKKDYKQNIIQSSNSGIIQFAEKRGLQPNYVRSNVEITYQTQNGKSRTILRSGNEPNSLRGISGSYVWIDELAKMRYAEEVYDQVKATAREGSEFGGSQTLITTTPRPTEKIKSLIDDPDVHVIRGSSWDNEENLDPGWKEWALKKKENRPKFYKQEILAEIVDEGGDLWEYDDIQRHKPEDFEDFTSSLVRIVIGLDPTVSNSEGDECGIVVVGKDASDTAYVLEDLSDQMTTGEWAERVVKAFWADFQPNKAEQFKQNKYPWPPADTIHAERNQGGGLVENQIRSVDQRVAYQSTHTTSSKRVRAEPVYNLYQRGKVKHVGQHSELEDQMTTFLQGNDSPDRVDALVYAVSELLLSDQMNPLNPSHVIHK